MDNNKRGSYHQIRDQYYYIEISLYNQIEGQEPLYVPFFFVDSITIHESLYNWITKGEIVFNSDFEIFARGGDNKKSDEKAKVPYIDRTDGRNRLSVIIYPVDASIDSGVIKENIDSSDKFPKKYWEINHDFVVMNIEDLPVNNSQRKKKRYIFVDERYQILKEKNLEWSSATIASKKLNKPAKSLKDSEAAINPCEALKELLKIASTNGDAMPKIKIGFNKNGSIDKPNIDLDKINEWDVGKTENLCVLYPDANTTALDDIFYILSHCVSSNGFPVILDYGRSSEDKGWHLICFSDYFKNSTKEQVEWMIIEDGLTNSLPYRPRASMEDKSQIHNFTSLVASRITSYQFSPMVAVDDNRLLNSPYCFFNEHTGSFEIKKEENSINKLIEKLQEMAKKGLYSFSENKREKPQIVLNANKTKTEGQMSKNKLALNGPYSSHSSPLMQMLLDSVFLNQSLSFQSPGLTIRTPGKFIAIEKVGSFYEKNAFDDRFLGQWMMTNVSHLFTQGEYVTQVVANKIDMFSEHSPTKDDNY
jgi:hypothetical protein